MDTKFLKGSKNYLDELKYEVQIYWFIAIFLFLAFVVGYTAIRDANSSVDKKLQSSSMIFFGSSIASEGRVVSYQGGTL